MVAAAATGSSAVWLACGARLAIQRGGPLELGLAVVAGVLVGILFGMLSGGRRAWCAGAWSLAAATAAAWLGWLLPGDRVTMFALQGGAVGALLGGAAHFSAMTALGRSVAVLAAAVAAAVALWYSRALTFGDDRLLLASIATGALGAIAVTVRRGFAPSPRPLLVFAALSAMAVGSWFTLRGAQPNSVAFVPLVVAVASAWAFAAALPAIGGMLAAGLVVVGGWVLWPALAADEPVLDRVGSTTVRYDRATQAVTLVRGDSVSAMAGPDHRRDELAATLASLGRHAGDRALVLGLGGMRTAACLAEVACCDVELVADDAGTNLPLALRLLGDGPVADPAARFPAGVHLVAARPLAYLRALPSGARQLVVVGEAMGSDGLLQAEPATQAALRRVAGDGPVLQAFDVERTPAAWLRELFAAAAACSAWNGVFVVGDCGVLVSAPAQPAWWCDAQPWPVAVRWLAHRAHLGGIGDVRSACRGTVVAAGTIADAWLDCVAPIAPAALDGAVASTLAVWQRQTERLAAAITALRGLDDDGDGRARAQQLAAELLPIGAPAAALQAALGLDGTDAAPLVNPAAASLRAQAIDPTFWAGAPPVFQTLPRPRHAAGDLEDLSSLPPRARLAELCVGNAPLAVALRARFASRCAEALVHLLAAGPLLPPAAEALRELADPLVLDEAGRVLRARGATAELLAFWRRDLPLPAALADLLGADSLGRARFAMALAGHGDRGSVAALADLLLDEEPAVRRAAGAALRVTAGDAVAYDPAWPRSELVTAADRVRALHNRIP